MCRNLSSSLSVAQTSGQEKGLSRFTASERSFEQGFSIIEMLVCLTILAAVLFYSVPKLGEHQELDRVGRDIKHAVHLARVHALLSNNDLFLRPLPECQDWSQGIALVRTSQDQTPKDEVLHRWYWHVPSLHVQWHGFQSARYLHFSSVMRHNTVNGHFTIQADKDRTLDIVINRLGRVIN